MSGVVSEQVKGFFSGLGICSFAHQSFAHLLRSLRSNERICAICSDCSGQMSNCEWTVQVAHSLFRSQKTSHWLKKIWLKLYFLVRDFVSFKKTSYERCEQIAQVPHQKWAMWANRSGRPPKLSDHEHFAQVAHQKRGNEWIACFFLANRLFAHYSLNFL